MCKQHLELQRNVSASNHKATTRRVFSLFLTCHNLWGFFLPLSLLLPPWQSTEPACTQSLLQLSLPGQQQKWLQISIDEIGTGPQFFRLPLMVYTLSTISKTCKYIFLVPSLIPRLGNGKWIIWLWIIQQLHGIIFSRFTAAKSGPSIYCTSQSRTEACHWAILSMFSNLRFRSLICRVTFLMTARAAATYL